MPTRAAATRRTARSRAKKVTAAPASRRRFADHTELLFEKTLNMPISATATGLHTLLYNATPSMQELAYKYGFSTGKSIHQNGGTVDALLALLQKGGLGPMLYSPSPDLSYIQSTERRTVFLLDGPAHHYERGLIAGYFSAYTDSPIITTETGCSWSGAEACTFTSSRVAVSQWMPGTDIRKVTACMASIIKQQPRKGEGADLYTLLALQPLLTGALALTVSRLLYIAGQQLAADPEGESLPGLVNKLGSFLGIRAELAQNTKAKKSITITYTLYSSTSQYVALTLPAFTGLFSSEYEQESANVRRNKEGAYLVSLNLKHR